MVRLGVSTRVGNYVGVFAVYNPVRRSTHVGGLPPPTCALKLDLFAMACVQLAPDSLGKRLSEVVRQQRAQRTRRD